MVNEDKLEARESSVAALHALPGGAMARQACVQYDRAGEETEGGEEVGNGMIITKHLLAGNRETEQHK